MFWTLAALALLTAAVAVALQMAIGEIRHRPEG